MSVALILVRHGKSGWDDETLDDHDRTLTDRGRESAARIGRWLAERALIPGAALVSSAQRTRETWSGIAAELPVRIEPEVTQALYHAGAGALLGQIRARTEPVVLVVGHNPGMGELAVRLAARPPAHPRFADYPTCATTVLSFADWAGAGWGKGRIEAFVTPRDLS